GTGSEKTAGQVCRREVPPADTVRLGPGDPHHRPGRSLLARSPKSRLTPSSQRRPHALSHLDLPDIPVGRVAGIFRIAENPAVAALADRRLLRFLRLVESLLPLSRSLLHGSG